MNIIFMGTPDFAVPSLKKLLDSKHHKVTAVFSQQPKPQGRGMNIVEPPIYKIASDYNIPVYTPLSLKNDEIEKLIKSIDADIIIVIAYGFIIPKNILKIKKYGCLNIHPSKLPKYRGAAPLQRTVINGEKETAVCIIQMDEGLDTGDILLEEIFPISDKITFPELHDKCANLGAEMLIDVLDNIDNIKSKKQLNEKDIIYAHKLSKEESKVKWEETALAIDCKIRGMNPWPGVYFEYEGKNIKIITAEWVEASHDYEAGTLIMNNSDFLEVACGRDILRILKLQPEGRRIMEAKSYLCGINSKQKIIKFG